MIAGNLFTRVFLLDGIRETEMWRTIDSAAFTGKRALMEQIIVALSARKNPNEAETEADLVYPILTALGWLHRDAQPNASLKARHDVPDALLYADAEATAAAGARDPWKRFAHGLCVVEAKRWQRSLTERRRPGRPIMGRLRPRCCATSAAWTSSPAANCGGAS